MNISFKNSAERFGAVAKSFHWVMALMMIGLLGLGFYMAGMERSPFKFELYSWHKSFGIVVLALVVFRVIWRFISAPPKALETHASWEKLLSKTIHIVLYVSMIGFPLSGWVMSSAGGHGVSVFGFFDMPAIVAENKDIGASAKLAHVIFAYSLIIALGLHILGGLKHHVVDKDLTLARMGASLWIVVPLVALFLVSVVFGVQELIPDLLSLFG